MRTCDRLTPPGRSRLALGAPAFDGDRAPLEAGAGTWCRCALANLHDLHQQLRAVDQVVEAAAGALVGAAQPLHRADQGVDRRVQIHRRVDALLLLLATSP